MNIKIKIEEHERLCSSDYDEYLFGSRLFGTHTSKSDYDYLRVYKYESVFNTFDYYLPNIHSFQYDDKENNTQYLWMTKQQFWKNLYSGDGTMQSDVILFDDKFNDEEAIRLCRTYKIIRAYCGVAKRDLKLHSNRKKVFHVERSLYIAQCLIDGELPRLENIKIFSQRFGNVEELKRLEKKLRNIASKLYENKELHNYLVPNTNDELLNKMLKANNIREFKY